MPNPPEGPRKGMRFNSENPEKGEGAPEMTGSSAPSPLLKDMDMAIMKYGTVPPRNTSVNSGPPKKKKPSKSPKKGKK